MSLKTRLRIAILALVLTVVLALTALNLHNTIEESFSNSQQRAELIAELVKSYTLERIRERAAMERRQRGPAVLYQERPANTGELRVHARR